MTEARDVRVLVLGDSFAAGVGDPTGLGWTGRVAAACAAAGAPVTVYPLGVRRETSAQVAARWRAEAAPRLVDAGDPRLVLAFGANDTSLEDDGRPRVAPARSVAVLARVLDEAAALGLPAWVAGPPPLGDEAQRARVVALSAAYAEACAPRDVPFADTCAPLLGAAGWWEECAAGDGFHPGARGYEALAVALLAAGLGRWLGA